MDEFGVKNVRYAKRTHENYAMSKERRVIN